MGSELASRTELLDPQAVIDTACSMLWALERLPLEERIESINKLRATIAKYSPFSGEPVDCVRWVRAETVRANDYNPNSVAPPEMALLELSISEDGYTQPIVTWQSDDSYEVIDGFHRHRVGKESQSVSQRLQGYLPVVVANKDRTGRNDRIAATIRHNRARGKHRVDAMSDIVVELKNRNWSNERIAKELGMDADEVLRLCQITGIAELFADSEFSRAWDVEGHITADDFEELTDDIETEEFRKVHLGGDGRRFYTYDQWECYKAGFYANTKPGMTREECETTYRDFLRDTEQFASVLAKLIVEWKHSCEHYLTNESMNRIAWLGQAAVCYAHGIPSAFRGGFSMLSEDEQNAANEVALKYLNMWLANNGRDAVTMEAAYSGRQADIY